MAAFFAGAFFAVDFAGVDFLAAEAVLPVDFLAADAVLPVVFFAVEAVLAVDFFAVEAVLPVVFFAVDAVFAGAFFAVDFAAPVCLVGAFFATAFTEPVASTASFGSFRAPDTTPLSSAPGLNWIAVFFDLIRSPVRGLRTQRASRTRFSNEAEPGDGDLLALRDLAGDGVQHRVEGVRRGLLVAFEASREGVDQLTLVHCLPFVNLPPSPCSTIPCAR